MVLAAYREHSVAEVAASLGRTDSYVRKLRGGWRPGRVDEDLWQRLVKLRNELAHGEATGSAPASGHRPISEIPRGMDPVTWAAAQFDLLSRLAGDASATLVHYRRGRDFTPEELGEIGGAVLDAADTGPRQSGEPPRRASGD